MVELRNGGMVGMAVRRKEWPNSRMAEMATYVLFMVHTDDDDDDDDDDDNDDDTLIFYSIDIIYFQTKNQRLTIKILVGITTKAKAKATMVQSLVLKHQNPMKAESQLCSRTTMKIKSKNTLTSTKLGIQKNV